ncbi:MAG: hypothetical protein H7Y89_13320 [Steroidobacteraceae bacterium]|nr:hypothetical protein [Steroidobacteraceae bacterium]
MPPRNEPWPNTLAAKVLASYFMMKYDISASNLRALNPPMGAMPFFNNSASAAIREAELALVAAAIQKFLLEVGVPLEKFKGNSLSKAHAALLRSMLIEADPSSGMAIMVDEHYRFMDEKKKNA